MNLGFRPVNPKAADDISEGRHMVTDADRWLTDIDSQLPAVDHVALARPVREDSVDAYIACCMCGWEGSKVTVSEAGGVSHARTRAMLAAERHASIEEDKVSRSVSARTSSGKPAVSAPPDTAGTFANKRSAA